MSAENEKNKPLDIDLPLASDPLTLSHENADKMEQPAASETQATATAKPEPETVAPAPNEGLRSSVRLSDVVKAPQPAAAPVKTEKVEKEEASEKKNAPAAERVKICPKCAHRQNDFYACRHCGLVFRNWRPEMERELFAAIPDGIYSAVQEMWRNLEKNWESDEAHEKFIQFCKGNNAVSYATRAYRLRAAKNPADARAAENMRKCSEFIGGMLQLMTPPGRSVKSSSITTGQITVAISIGVILIIIFFMLFDYMFK